MKVIKSFRKKMSWGPGAVADIIIQDNSNLGKEPTKTWVEIDSILPKKELADWLKKIAKELES